VSVSFPFMLTDAPTVADEASMEIETCVDVSEGVGVGDTEGEVSGMVIDCVLLQSLISPANS
jgi:hypothetical protein